VLKITDINSGVYLLEIYAAEQFSVDIEIFKNKVFPAGYYYYSGSAQKNLEQRVDRHRKEEKNIHWQIDHITSIKTNKIKSVFLFEGAKKNFECTLIRELMDEFRLRMGAKGFGNSDCRRCPSHLLYCKQKMTHSHFIARYHSTVRLMPSSSETV